ncbi:hypothetical protein DQ04_00111040 [Trypanosoma grayi]|uniref:hypothetical protein n=1 Tax=Trypanosoma grayi TaxID=71804 RepID=UPI0004F40996|nr:hypothetical protein DQ04_00111040 [Trypanosoma grayi]KEG15304.1 hypothetical protein DQ04_00111040 [Trypanosoma grayi]
MKRFAVLGVPVSPCCSQQLLHATARTNIIVPRRCKATFLRVANRKRVEMFVGKRFHLPTRLKTAAPEIAMEWDHDKNPMHLYPEIIGIGHVSPVWWKCAACQHSYSMSVEKRVVRGGGCPVCTAAAKNAAAPTEGTLEGEAARELRPKRSVMFNMRTKY